MEVVRTGCMCTNYDYAPPEDPRFAENRAQIEEFYRKLHAENYDDPNDERLAAMWLLSGSLLFRGNVCKKAYIFLGSEGDNGKSTFTELIQLTLGDYAVTGNRSSLSGPSDQATLDPDLVANHKSLACSTFISAPIMKVRAGAELGSVRHLPRDKRQPPCPAKHSSWVTLISAGGRPYTTGSLAH
jgi:hypothetical protein